MGKKSQRERREMLEQMQQTRPKPVRLDELKERMEERAKFARKSDPIVAANQNRPSAPVVAARPKRPWWQRLFGRQLSHSET
jgi:hypothetical protein